jgi:hypothetical protein
MALELKAIIGDLDFRFSGHGDGGIYNLRMNFQPVKKK